MAVKYKKAEGKELGLGPGGIGMAAGKGIMSGLKTLKKLYGKRPKKSQTKPGEWKGGSEIKVGKNPVAEKYAKKPMGKKPMGKKPLTVQEARVKAQEATRTAPKPKTGSRIPMKPKTAIAKALKATSEAGQRAIKAGTKSRKTYGGTYKRFKVK